MLFRKVVSAFLELEVILFQLNQMKILIIKKQVMKNQTKSICAFLFLAGIVLTSCVKEEHTMRLVNNYGVKFTSVVIGSEQVGVIENNQSSDYVPVKVGTTVVSGIAFPATQLSASVSIKGKGKHKWSVTVGSNGSINLLEDK